MKKEVIIGIVGLLVFAVMVFVAMGHRLSTVLFLLLVGFFPVCGGCYLLGYIRGRRSHG